MNANRKPGTSRSLCLASHPNKSCAHKTCLLCFLKAEEKTWWHLGICCPPVFLHQDPQKARIIAEESTFITVTTVVFVQWAPQGPSLPVPGRSLAYPQGQHGIPNINIRGIVSGRGGGNSRVFFHTYIYINKWRPWKLHVFILKMMVWKNVYVVETMAHWCSFGYLIYDKILGFVWYCASGYSK